MMDTIVHKFIGEECPICNESDGNAIMYIDRWNQLYVHCFRNINCPSKHEMRSRAEMNRHIRTNYPDLANYTANFSATNAYSKPKNELKRLESGIIFADELDIIQHLIGKGKIKENYANLIGVKMTDDWMYKEAFIEQYHQHYHHNDIQIYYRDNGFFIAHYLMRGKDGKGVVSIKRRMFYFDGDILKQIPEANGKGNWKREALLDESFSACFRAFGFYGLTTDECDIIVAEGEMDACVIPNAVAAWNNRQVVETCKQLIKHYSANGDYVTLEVIPDADNYVDCERELKSITDYHLTDLRKHANGNEKFDILDFVKLYGHADFDMEAEEYIQKQSDAIDDLPDIELPKTKQEPDINAFLLTASENNNNAPPIPKKTAPAATMAPLSAEAVYDKIMQSKVFNTKLYDRALELKDEMNEEWLFNIASKLLCDKKNISKRDVFYAVRFDIIGAMEFTINKDERRGYERAVF